MITEAAYQSRLIKKIQALLPGSFVLKNDTSQYQGLPDLLILWGSTWAMLEVKRSEDEPFQPNQEYYVDSFNGMSFAAVIYPENEEQVLDELQSTLGAEW